MFAQIPNERNLTSNFRSSRPYNKKFVRTVRVSTSTYFQNTLFEWNLHVEDIRNSLNIAEFKRKGNICPLGKATCGIHGIERVTFLTELRLKFSVLNAYSFRHYFDCLTPIFNCGAGKEDNEHFFLHCSQLDLMCTDLFGHLLEIPLLDINDIKTADLCTLLLYGNSKLNIVASRIILEATIYIMTTQRLR